MTERSEGPNGRQGGSARTNKIGQLPRPLHPSRELPAVAGPRRRQRTFQARFEVATIASTARQCVARRNIIRVVQLPLPLDRHRNSLGELTPIVSALDRADATFIARAGLGLEIAVSLESVNFPGHFLRHQDFRLKLHRNDGSDLFRNDATFMYNDGAAWEGNRGVSLESVNFPGHFIRHFNFQLWLAQSDGSEVFGNDATWQPVPARMSG